MSTPDVDGYDVIADVYDKIFGEKNVYYARVNSEERKLFDKWVPQPKGDAKARALDVGCGTGFHTAWLSSRGYRAIGIDVSEEMLRVARREVGKSGASIEFRRMCASDLKRLGHRWSVVTCLGSSLNHISDWRQFCKSVGANLEPDGLFVFSYDNIAGIDLIARLLLREIRGYDRRYLRTVVLRRWIAAVFGRTFRNHWHVDSSGRQTAIALTYESSRRWLRHVREAGMEVVAIRGVHIGSCFDRVALAASAGLSCGAREGTTRIRGRLVDAMDRIIGLAIPSIAAHVVGVARKLR